MEKKPKIRNLVRNSEFRLNTNSSAKTRISILVIVLIAGLVLNVFSEYFVQFYYNFEEEYNYWLANNIRYCSLGNFNAREIIENIKFDIINQDEALYLIEQKLNMKNKLISLAIIGSSGVGKTKFSHSFRKNFFWPENIQQYRWFTLDDEKNLKIAANNFRKCGRNLIIIDALPMDYLSYINQFNEELENIVNLENIWLIIIYIFNLSRYDAVDERNFKIELEKFTNNINSSIHIINFRTFNETDLFKCIKNECRIFNVSLNTEKINNILKIHNVKRSGCKNIQAKVLLHKYL